MGDREENEDSTYIILLTINETISFILSISFLILVIISKSKFNNKARIRTITLYISTYAAASFILALDGISDNFDLYDANGGIDVILDVSKITGFILSHELFYILLIEKLHYTFKDSSHRINKKIFTGIIVASIIIEIYHFFIRIIINYDYMSQIHIPLLVPFMVLSIIFGVILISIFGTKLFSVILTSRKSLHYGNKFMESSPASQFSVISRMSLNSHQLTLVRAITKNVILSVLAIIFRNLEILFYGFSRIQQHRLEHDADDDKHKHRHTMILILYSVVNICLFCQLSCVYLSYSYFMGANEIYDKLCGGLHKFVQGNGVKYAQKRLTAINMKTIQSYRLLNDSDGFTLDSKGTEFEKLPSITPDPERVDDGEYQMTMEPDLYSQITPLMEDDEEYIDREVKISGTVESEVTQNGEEYIM